MSISSFIQHTYSHRTSFQYARIADIQKATLIDIGCGNNKFHPKAIGLDKFKLPGVDILWDITKKPYPLQSSTVDIVHCSQVLEHLPYEKHKILLSECSRILKKNGILDLRVPHAFSIASHQDPTHATFFTFLSIEHYLGLFNSWYIFQIPELRLMAYDVQVFTSKQHNSILFWWILNMICTAFLKLMLRISPLAADVMIKILPFYAVDIIWILRKSR